MMKRGKNTGTTTKAKGSGSEGREKKSAGQRDHRWQEDLAGAPDSLSLVRLASALSASGRAKPEPESWQLPHGEDIAEYALRNGLMAPAFLRDDVAVDKKRTPSGRPASTRSLRGSGKRREG